MGKELNIDEIQKKLDQAREEYEEAKAQALNIDEFDESDDAYFVTDEYDDEYGVFLGGTECLYFSDVETHLQFDNAGRKIKLYSLLKQLAANPDDEGLKEAISSQIAFGEMEAKRVVEMEGEYLSLMGEVKELI